MRVVVRIAGAAAPERDDVTAESLENNAPFSCSKVIDVKEGAKFSIHAFPGLGICQLLARDEGLMVLIHLDDTEVLRRLYTKTAIDSRASRRFRMDFDGVLGVDSGGRQILQPFKFGTTKKGGRAIRGTIRVDSYIVKLLGSPERTRLNDTATSRSSIQAKNVGPGKEVKKVLAADTYDVKRLNYERPIARFDFRYGPKGNLPMHKPKDNNENSYAENLIEVSANKALPKNPPSGFRGTGATNAFSKSPPKLDGLPVASTQTQTTTSARTASTTTASLDLGDKPSSQLNRRIIPIRTKPPQPVMKNKKLQREVLDDEAISIHSFDSKDVQLTRKRFAVVAFGNDSPSRPRKFIATSTY
ncbi:hypothetical protein BDP55DRAFT_769466 [Colletotrichum godetiae]|uniref:DUF7918 domain-containing protein n=1 Tax=Colletotrichum godetiae TaxID=1209918 RepID=A0AAJ0EWN4_9PEZI|nr:uncharacterized protein BDP55DRAFT_769466 [Colletotrichum godetiae]KAK1674394.1 hypothetical protein BDP55DRAFT_769466 [Colletotrichum godetiae]